MQVIGVESTGSKYEYRWPKDKELYDYFIDYKAASEKGCHLIRIGYCTRRVYGKNRMRVVVWVDGNPQAEFVGTDDFDKSGEVLSEIKLPSKGATRMCRYPDEVIPQRYILFNVVGMPTRIHATGVHNAWAVAANLAVALSLKGTLEILVFEKENFSKKLAESTLTVFNPEDTVVVEKLRSNR